MWIHERWGKHVEWQIDMFQHFEIPHWNHRMLFIGVTGDGVWTAVTCVRKQRDPSGDKLRLYEKHIGKQMMVTCTVLNSSLD